MDRNIDQSVPAARALVEQLPPLIAQADAGKLDISVYMLRMALKEARKLVEEADGRCGRIASASDFLRQLGER